MTDEEKIMQYLQQRNATICPPILPSRVDYHRPTASSYATADALPDSRTPNTSQQRLAQAILAHMLQTLGGALTGYLNAYEVGKLHNDARRWFFNRDSNFIEVCDLAGYDPDYARARARRIMADGLPDLPAELTGKRPERRKPPTKGKAKPCP
jgi:hypothetical protein